MFSYYSDKQILQVQSAVREGAGGVKLSIWQMVMYLTLRKKMT